MSESHSDPHQNGKNFEGNRGGFRGSRGPGNRDQGGFRIRLSDNEMRASRSLQEAFNLRSTVAVLGFALRTLAQMLEEGKLDELIAQQRAQGGGRVSNRRDDGSTSPGSRRNRYDGDRPGAGRGIKPNPFARPEKPQKTLENATSASEEAQKDEVTPNEAENDSISTNPQEESNKIINEGENSTSSSEI